MVRYSTIISKSRFIKGNWNVRFLLPQSLGHTRVQLVGNCTCGVKCLAEDKNFLFDENKKKNKRVCKITTVIKYDFSLNIRLNIYMGGLVLMVISTKNWEFLPNSISTM